LHCYTDLAQTSHYTMYYRKLKLCTHSSLGMLATGLQDCLIYIERLKKLGLTTTDTRGWEVL